MTIISVVFYLTGRPFPGCDRQEGTTEGAVRLRGGFGTLCDPVHSGFIEVLHFGEWGSICTDGGGRAEDNLVADVVCRQLGFPHGTRIDPLTSRPPPSPSPSSPPDGEAPPPYSTDYSSSYYDYAPITEEAEEPVERFWLSEVTCSGPEERLIDCNLDEGFRNNFDDCRSNRHRIHIACRQFPVVEALEEITTPDAGRSPLCIQCSHWLAVPPYVCMHDYTAVSTKTLTPPVTNITSMLHPCVYTTCTTMIHTFLLLCLLRIMKGRCPPAQLDIFWIMRYIWHNPGRCLAEEGDLRLVDEAPVANWMTGLLQVFFEGSWSQVCNGFFDVADANVACRQLGFGAGTVVPQFLSEADLATLQSTPVFPEIAITSSGCTGSEERLVDCEQEVNATPAYSFDDTFGRDCLSSNGAGLRIACVASPVPGTTPVAASELQCGGFLYSSTGAG